MLLGIDAGNTTVTFIKGDLKNNREPEIIYRCDTNEILADSKRHIGPVVDSIEDEESVECVVVSSVLGEKDDFLKNLKKSIGEKLCKKFNSKRQIPFINVSASLSDIDLSGYSADTLGADRVADMEGVLYIRESNGITAGNGFVTIDFGTATTINVVDGKNRFLGGIICPGIKTAGEALLKNARNLSEYHIDTVSREGSVIGTNSEECIKKGIVLGHAFMAEEFVKRIKTEVGDEKMEIYVTGGNLPYVNDIISRTWIRDEKLLYKGLMKIAGNQIFNKNYVV